MSIQDPQLGQEQRMGGVGCVPLPGACLGMQRRISAWGMPKSGKKPKFPAGGQCGEQEETDFWMKPCLNSFPGDWELGAMCSGSTCGGVWRAQGRADSPEASQCQGHGLPPSGSWAWDHQHQTPPSPADHCLPGALPPTSCPTTWHPQSEVGYSSRMRIRVFRVSNWSSSAVTSGWLRPARMSRSR